MLAASTKRKPARIYFAARLPLCRNLIMESETPTKFGCRNGSREPVRTLASASSHGRAAAFRGRARRIETFLKDYKCARHLTKLYRSGNTLKITLEHHRYTANHN